jgi:hypothetical protein
MEFQLEQVAPDHETPPFCEGQCDGIIVPALAAERGRAMIAGDLGKFAVKPGPVSLTAARSIDGHPHQKP